MDCLLNSIATRLQLLPVLIVFLQPGQVSAVGKDSPVDLSGVWFPVAESRRVSPDPLPFTERTREVLAEYEKNFTLDDDPGRYCIKPGMPRAIWGPPFALEIFQSEKEISIFWEAYSMMRKLYFADQDPPDSLVPTLTGHSLARWEGNILVVETSNLLPYPNMRRMPTSSNASVVEKITIDERVENGTVRKYLLNELTLTDPGVYSEPVHIYAEMVYRPDLHLLEYNCTDVLWQGYLDGRGLQLPDLDQGEE